MKCLKYVKFRIRNNQELDEETVKRQTVIVKHNAA